MKTNYKEISFDEYVRLGALRWLHSIDFREHSSTYGVADREYWAWKTKDFPNGTMQAGLAGFLDAHSLLNYKPNEVTRVVSAVINGTLNIQRSNGSFEEAYPYESSYAVTGLVLFDLLYSYLSYPHFFTKEDKSKLDTIALKSQRFIEKTPETHGIISNHLASSVLALELFHLYQGTKNTKTALRDFIGLQKSEGWFPEYEGADPGYQTLLNSYIIRYLSLTSNQELEIALNKSLQFVSHFFSPSGDFSGEIGSRGTAIPYPASLTPDHGQKWFKENYLSSDKAVTPITIDNGNFVPLWNSWCFAITGKKTINFQFEPKVSITFSEAGLMVQQTKNAFLAVNLNTGVCLKYSQTEAKWKDESLCALEIENKFYRPFKAILNKDQSIVIHYGQSKYTNELNSALRSIVLRLIGLGLYFFPALQRAIKIILAGFVMKKQNINIKNTQTITIDLRSDVFVILKPDSAKIIHRGHYAHMASANYFPGIN